MLGYVWERTLHVAKAIVKGIIKKFLNARESSETLGNARERSHGFASKGDKAIVVECVNNGISAYRRVTDRSARRKENVSRPPEKILSTATAEPRLDQLESGSRVTYECMTCQELRKYHRQVDIK